MSISTLYATEFRHELGTGRTKPCVFNCCDADGNEVGDMVVKLKGGLDFAELGSFAEYSCSLLAKYLDIACPEPFFVEIDTALSAGIPDSSVAERVRKSGGLNFASRYLASYSEWIPSAKLSAEEQPQAARILAFDAFVQNPDRRTDKHNLLLKNNSLVAIDHELAFSFALDIFPKQDAWRITQEVWLRNHLFFKPLYQKPLDWKELHSKFDQMRQEKIADKIIASAPSEWHTYKQRRYCRISNQFSLTATNFSTN
ncbi:MAG: hypothetical protein MUF71_16395 [Candidatus Kapabacteria bacterium]|jgi:hypothetical protein|nr:hypothetical protein [Candidatus Kapabacteria bacterium]